MNNQQKVLDVLPIGSVTDLRNISIVTGIPADVLHGVLQQLIDNDYIFNVPDPYYPESAGWYVRSVGGKPSRSAMYKLYRIQMVDQRARAAYDSTRYGWRTHKHTVGTVWIDCPHYRRLEADHKHWIDEFHKLLDSFFGFTPDKK